MARVNVGINPASLTDQHLIAESVEITMITGALKKQNFKIVGKIPDKFVLGAGHINFFKNKIQFLHKRLALVNDEMRKRGFTPGTYIDLSEYPKELCNDWQPSIADAQLIKERIELRILNPTSKREVTSFWKYRGCAFNNMQNLQTFLMKMHNSSLYF